MMYYGILLSMYVLCVLDIVLMMLGYWMEQSLLFFESLMNLIMIIGRFTWSFFGQGTSDFDNDCSNERTSISCRKGSLINVPPKIV